MTEDDAKAWITARSDVSRETLDKLERFVETLSRENEKQNLVSQSTLPQIWSRHVVDSIQILDHLDAVETDLPAMDLGSGAGLPGLVLAIVRPQQSYRLVESRKLRCEFLSGAAEDLNLVNVTVVRANLKAVEHFAAGVITARAFAPLRNLIDMAKPFSTEETRWVLPRGAKGVREWQELPRRHKDMFHVEQSVTDDEAVILVGKGAA